MMEIEENMFRHHSACSTSLITRSTPKRYPIAAATISVETSHFRCCHRCKPMPHNSLRKFSLMAIVQYVKRATADSWWTPKCNFFKNATWTSSLNSSWYYFMKKRYSRVHLLFLQSGQVSSLRSAIHFDRWPHSHYVFIFFTLFYVFINRQNSHNNLRSKKRPLKLLSLKMSNLEGHPPLLLLLKCSSKSCALCVR